MPRYYFHIRGGRTDILDLEGADHADPAAARVEAVEGARAILSEKIRAGRLPLDERIDVESEDGELVARVPFADVVTIRFPPEGKVDSQPM